jgi:hypothetical protein
LLVLAQPPPPSLTHFVDYMLAFVCLRSGDLPSSLQRSSGGHSDDIDDESPLAVDDALPPRTQR